MKQYICPICNKIFTDPNGFNGHKASHNDETNQTRYEKGAKKYQVEQLQKRIIAYNNNPKHCLNCSSVIPYDKKIRKFCNSSCSCTYNNAHKKYGTTISKLEKWIQTKLINLYPNIEFHFNRKDAINSELDIYIPSLKLAFELNGIFHYEPIFGADKLMSIQNNDDRKFQACYDRGIALCIIDSSKQKYVKESNSIKFLDIITNTIEKKVAGQ